MIQIHKNSNHSKDFTFFTLMTRFHEYSEMVESAKNAGFIDCEFLYFNNKQSNDFDGFSGINYAIKNCKSKYLIFCHQDILFNHDTKQNLTEKINELESIDPNWAVIGNAGVTEQGKVSIKITDPHGENQTKGPFPSKVMSVDENFIIINTEKNFGCSTNLYGFHLYGLDLCQNANYLGLNSYVIDFHLSHKSKGNIDKSFFESRSRYIIAQEKRKQSQFFFTTCTRFYVTKYKFINFILNNKFVLKLLSVFLKNRN